MLTEAQLQIIEMSRGEIRKLHVIAEIVNDLSDKHSEEEILSKLSEILKINNFESKMVFKAAKTYLEHF